MNGPIESQPASQEIASAVASNESANQERVPNRRNSNQWLRLLFASNPFYVVSVALLLFGCYRISMEPALFNHESAHLFFNFISLQLYEMLLVGTAIFLARRRIWIGVGTRD